MSPRFLLDTHILIRWLIEPKRLSKEQTRLLRDATHRREPVSISAITLVEIAVLSGMRRSRERVPVSELLTALESNPTLLILPMTIDIAREVAALAGPLHDPGDAVIVATARVHNLRLLTSDQRIIASHLVNVVE